MSDEGSLTQLHASPFHLPTWLLVRTESLLEREGALFFARTKPPASAKRLVVPPLRLGAKQELLCRNPASTEQSASPITNADTAGLTQARKSS